MLYALKVPGFFTVSYMQNHHSDNWKLQGVQPENNTAVNIITPFLSALDL